MAKRIILYNLADNITEDEFKEYVLKEKGPLIESLPSVKKYELVKIENAAGKDIPYKYVGIVNLTGLEDYEKKDVLTEEYQSFLKNFVPKIKDLLVLNGEEIY